MALVALLLVTAIDAVLESVAAVRLIHAQSVGATELVSLALCD